MIRGNTGWLSLCGCLLSALINHHSALAQTAQLSWDTQLDRPVDHPLIIYRGETLDLLPRLVQGTDPVSITNTYLYFRYREPALVSSNLYREVAISTNSAPGTLELTWTPAFDVGADYYNYEFVVGPDSNANPRVHGRITMKGTISYPASTNAPAPSTRWMTDLDLADAIGSMASTASVAEVAAALQSTSNELSQAITAVGADKATVTQVNQVAEDLQTASNDLAQAVQDVQTYTETNLTTRLSAADDTSWTEIVNGTQMLYTVHEGLATNSNQLLIYDSAFSSLGIRTMNRYDTDLWRVIGYNDEWNVAGDYYGNNNFVVGSGQSEGGEYLSYTMVDPNDFVSFPKLFAFEEYQGGNTGWVALVTSPIMVTNSEPIITEAAMSAAIFAPTNAVSGWLLYDSGSNVWLTVTVSNLSFKVFEVQ